MKVYIAGKIGNIPFQIARQAFDSAAERLRDAGIEVINPCDLGSVNNTWAENMQVDLHALLDCDGLYALSNWRQSPGATIEVQLALRLGKSVWMEDVSDPLCQCVTCEGKPL